MKRWMFIALLVVGLLAFAAVIWFATPFIVFGAVAPFEPVWVRALIVGVVWLAIGGFYLIRFLRRRAAAKRLEEGMLAGAGSDEKVLAERMGEALATLKSAAGKSGTIYSLPWYVIIGPPGSGKTTALLNSGLKFVPLGANAAISGVAGTRYCDWWFTDEAVLIDTAGRYTTQDSDQSADKASWLSFLGLLKKNRPKQPINGAIVAISLLELMQKSPAELAEHANAIRARLLEIHNELRIEFPVYMLFTKADLLAGFNEYFGNFTESRRRKVWGATFRTEDKRKNMVASVPEEMDALVRRLTEELPDRLQEEPDAISRIAIYAFPAQYSLLREKVVGLLTQIFEPNRYQVNANLRGFYFTSGTQEGTPIDQVLGAMDQAFGTAAAPRQYSGLGKSYFLHDLVRQVIFSESGWVSTDRGAVRRAGLIRGGSMAVIGIAALAALGAWGWSYFNNDGLLGVTDQSVANYRVAAGDYLNASTVSDFDLESIVPSLDMLAGMPVGYQHRQEGVPLNEGFGLSQRGQLVAAAQVTYRQALERMLRSRLILRLEDRLGTVMSDPMAVYETLKVYMMLTGVGDAVDKDYVVAWMKQDWEQNLYPGPNYRALRDDLEVHLRAMLELEPGHQPSFEPNGTLIQSAQTTLTRLSIADQAYSYLRSLPPAVPIDDFNVASRLGADAQTVFETVDGSDFGSLTIPAFLTYRGFHEHLLSELSSIADRLRGELWVRGEPGKAMVTDEQFAQLGPQLLALYSKDFIAAWSGLLDNLKLKTMPGEKPDYIALSVASNPATSPIKLLVQAVASETGLTKEPAEPAPDAASPLGDAATAGSPAALALQAATARTGGLAKIGIALALKKSDARPGDPGTAQQLPGANIEAQFKDYSVLLDGSPQPIDGVIENLNEVYRNLVIAARNPSQAPQATTAAQLGVSTLSVNASRFPTAMRRILSGAVSDLEGDAAGSSLAQLNQSLAGQVTRICEQFTSNLYPFSSSSQRDVPMADFARLFAPNGVLDKFFTENLATLADLSGETWTWRTDTALGRELSNASLREFQRAAQIRDAFFPPNAVDPSVSLTIQQVSLNPAADMALLDINGTVYQGQQVGSAQVTMQWPTSQGTGVVNLTMTPELPGRESAVSIQGPWALMRLIDRNTVSRRGDELRLRVVIGGRDVDYAIRVGTLFNPFFLPALSEFSCPSGL